MSSDQAFENIAWPSASKVHYKVLPPFTDKLGKYYVLTQNYVGLFLEHLSIFLQLLPVAMYCISQSTALETEYMYILVSIGAEYCLRVQLQCVFSSTWTWPCNYVTALSIKAFFLVGQLHNHLISCSEISACWDTLLMYTYFLSYVNPLHQEQNWRTSITLGLFT